jgi:MFS family permease
MSFFQTFAYTAGTFYLVLYYQAVQGANALMAGLLSLPYSLGSALISTLASQYVQHTQRYREVIICGLGLSTLGFGLSLSFPLILAVAYRADAHSTFVQGL